MLDQRMQILLDAQTAQQLRLLSVQKKTSMSELVRGALHQTYVMRDKQEAIDRVRSLRKKGKGLSLDEILSAKDYGRRF